LAVWKVPRQCPLVLLVKDLNNFGFKLIKSFTRRTSGHCLVKDLINFGFKDVGAAVVSGMEANFGRAILWRKILKS
jgi:hypothetical protein